MCVNFRISLSEFLEEDIENVLKPIRAKRVIATVEGVNVRRCI